MKHLFVSKELAEQLRDKGFSEPCLADYALLTPDHHQLYGCGIVNFDINRTFINTTGTIIPAPIYQQVIDWFRDTYDISVLIIPYRNDDGTLVYEWTIINDIRDEEENEITFMSYYECLEDAIKEVLKVI